MTLQLSSRMSEGFSPSPPGTRACILQLLPPPQLSSLSRIQPQVPFSIVLDNTSCVPALFPSPTY
eukprot:9160224-Ditylum_brightwellii.AAC.1